MERKAAGPDDALDAPIVLRTEVKRRATKPGKPRSRSKKKKPKVSRLSWVALGLESIALLSAALILVIALLGNAASRFSGIDLWKSLLPFAASVLAILVGGLAVASVWLWLRRKLATLWFGIPAAVALVMVSGAIWLTWQPRFQEEVLHLQTFVGGHAEAERQAIAHQVYAAYRRANRKDLQIMLDRAHAFEPVILEAGIAFGLDAEVLVGIGAAESSFLPRDSKDGGRGLFQITLAPAAAESDVRARLKVDKLDPVNPRHNAFIAAATLRHYLDEMNGDLFLALLAYNIGPRNGGMASIMKQYGARDFVTIQPYLQNLPRDYPIRVLSSALAYRLARREGTLVAYEDGTNAAHIQEIGIPGLDPDRSAALRAAP